MNNELIMNIKHYCVYLYIDKYLYVNILSSMSAYTAFAIECMQWPCGTLSVRLQNCVLQHFCLRLGKKIILFPKIDVSDEKHSFT